MVDLTFSHMLASSTPQLLEMVIKEFAAQTGIHITDIPLDWNDAWTDLIRFALYNNGPEISEIGSTWVGDFVAMNALRPFSSSEVASLGGADAFIPSIWQSVMVAQQAQVWSIPWLIDTRLLYYRRDLLEQAGINPQQAFATDAVMKHTLQSLKDAGGCRAAFCVSTQHTRLTLQNAASWVWGNGGGFVSLDGRQVLLNHPEALTGFQQYFELMDFIPEDLRQLDSPQSDRLFAQGQAAVTLSGPWLMRNSHISAELRDQIGVTFPPGVPFVGGSNLVIWRHCHHLEESLALVRILTSERFQQHFLFQIGMLSARAGALNVPPYTQDGFFAHLSEGLQRGRSLPVFPLWGMVEERLLSTLNQTWNELVSDTSLDRPTFINHRMDRLARQLEIILRGA